MGWRVGAAIGATFTDVGLIDEETGTIGIAKTQDFTAAPPAAARS